MVSNCPTNIGNYWVYLWTKIYGHTLWNCFLSHQIGSFVGVWLGGIFYDKYGNYDIVWWVGIGVGAFSALIHLPVKEVPLSLRKKIIIAYKINF